MSVQFQTTMKDISAVLKQAYNARRFGVWGLGFGGSVSTLISNPSPPPSPSVAIIPGSGSFGMEAVARQFATGKRALVIRNGWFRCCLSPLPPSTGTFVRARARARCARHARISFRWTQIFEAGSIVASHTVLKASRADAGDAHSSFAPPPLAEVIERINSERPDIVFAPHVETSAGIMLSDEYVRAVAEAAHGVGVWCRGVCLSAWVCLCAFVCMCERGTVRVRDLRVYCIVF